MNAVTVTPTRELEVREVPTPTEAPNGHLLIEIDSAAINHGDKTFLKMPAAALGLNVSQHDIWGVSAAGRVLVTGPGVPALYAGKKVAVYRSLTPSTETVGVWSEQASRKITPLRISPVFSRPRRTATSEFSSRPTTSTPTTRHGSSAGPSKR